MKDPSPPPPARYDRMTYRRCGRWGLKLPLVSLGAAFETIGGRLDFDTSRALLTIAFEHGITHFDLANNYGLPPGNSETVVGQIVRDLPRHEIILSTKAGFRGWPGPYGVGLSKKYLISSLEQSLRRLDMDYVDIFYAHAPDDETPIDETLSALDLVVKQGKALYVGVANFSPDQYRKALAQGKGLEPITVFQTPYNILGRGAEEELLPLLDATGCGCVGFYVLGQGVLTGKYRGGKIPENTRIANLWTDADKQVGLNQRAMEQIEELAEIAEARGQTLAQMCIAWTLRQSPLTSVVLGASRPEQIVENVKALENLEFSDEERARIDDISPPPGRKAKGRLGFA